MNSPMKIIHRIILLVLAITLMLSTSTYAEDYIRVGSYNIANFGTSKAGEYERSLIYLVNIIVKMDADIIALQEIEATDFGTKQVERLTKLLNKAAKYYKTPAYEFIIADEHTGDETVAYLWRDPVILESEILLMEHDRDPDSDEVPTFQREPHYALFSADNYDFYLVNCHLYMKIHGNSSEGRGDEFDSIVKWLKDLATEDEKNAIVIGDFNDS